MRAILIKDQIKYVCYSTRIYLKKKKKKTCVVPIAWDRERERERISLCLVRMKGELKEKSEQNGIEIDEENQRCQSSSLEGA